MPRGRALSEDEEVEQYEEIMNRVYNQKYPINSDNASVSVTVIQTGFQSYRLVIDAVW